MTFLIKNIVSAFFYISLIFISPAIAKNNPSVGNVHFQSSVVNPSCSTSMNKFIELTCVKDGRLNNKNFDFKKINAITKNFKQITRVNLGYFNKSKNLAILTIEYR